MSGSIMEYKGYVGSATTEDPTAGTGADDVADI